MAGNFELGLFYAVARSDLAARHFAIAAASGTACARAAAANLGCMYDRGLGGPRDDVRAAHWHARAAVAGDASAGDRDAMLALESLCPE